jgi:hypothetical protein
VAIVTIDDVQAAAPRFAAGVADELIDAFIEEEEDYVIRQLDLDPLPDDNFLLYTVVRDLAISRVAYAMQRAGSDDLALADAMRREALRRLFEARDDGLTQLGAGAYGSADELVYNEFDSPFFTLEDFDL